jgi:hypothetical protein
MLILFAPILAALGAAFICRGRKVRGFLVIASALAAELLVSIATQRWPWVAFTAGMLTLCALGIMLSRNGGNQP